MPGFNIGGGAGPNPVAEPRRKHRWVFLIDSLPGITQQSALFLQKASRPTFKYESPEMHHDQEVAYFAGKQSWDPITLSFYDIESSPNSSAEIFSWVTSVTKTGLTNGASGEITVAPPAEYKKDCILQMTDGAGGTSETWVIRNAWPLSTNWMDLDYTSTDLQLIEVSMRYDRAGQTA